jgi:gamma-glutamylaminecyclotransferase
MRTFVYGTLTDADTAASVLDSFEFRGTATCSGLHRADGEYPTLLPGGEVTGRILATPDTEALDRYEGVDRGLYVRVSLPCESGGSVETYVGDPARLGVEESWPGSEPFPDCVRSFLDTHDVTVTLDSP